MNNKSGKNSFLNNNVKNTSESNISNPNPLKSIAPIVNNKIQNVNIFSEDDKKFWFEVFIFGGKKETGIDVITWAKEAEKLGAGEILLTSIDADGTKTGYDILLTKSIVDNASIPVIASGGCGKPEDMVEIFEKSNVDAALAASIFHYETHGVKGVKSFLKEKKIPVRL